MKQVYMAVAAVLLFSCSAKTESEVAEIKLAKASPLAAEMSQDKVSAKSGDFNLSEKLQDQVATASTDQAVGSEQQAPPKKEATHENWDKKIIKTANINLELTNYKKYDRSIHEGLKAFGAYIANEEQVADDNKLLNQISIKVPVTQFENLVNSFSGEGIKLLQKKINSEDVTEEMVDVKSRLETRKQMRERYLAFLKQAKNMKEILEVQTEINSIQEEIESAAGRANYLGHQSAYSTINLSYFQYIDSGKKPVDANGFAFRLNKGFQNGVAIIGSLFIFIVSLWPVILLGAIGIFLWKKRKQIHPQA